MRWRAGIIAPAASVEASEGATMASVTVAANGEATIIGGGRAGVDDIGNELISVDGGFFVI